MNSQEFLQAVKFSDYKTVSQALEIDVHYADQIDYFGQTAFHWAAKLGNDKMLDLLFRYSERCNIFDKKLRTPLYLAALNNHKKSCEILIDHGANPQMYDMNGKKPENVTNDLGIKLILQTGSFNEKDYFEFNMANRKKITKNEAFIKIDKKEKENERNKEKEKEKNIKKKKGNHRNIDDGEEVEEEKIKEYN